MRHKRIMAPLSVLLLALGGYVIFYCFKKLKLAAGSTTTVGDDVIVVGYIVTLSTALASCLTSFAARREAVGIRAVPTTALLVCIGALSFWCWLHLSGVVVAYPSVAKP